MTSHNRNRPAGALRLALASRTVLSGVTVGQYREDDRLIDIVHTQPGADLKTSAGTWWGAFNAVTYYYDHVAGTDQDKRLTSAWFGSAATRKRQALDLAVEFAEAV